MYIFIPLILVLLSVRLNYHLLLHPQDSYACGLISHNGLIRVINSSKRDFYKLLSERKVNNPAERIMEFNVDIERANEHLPQFPQEIIQNYY